RKISVLPGHIKGQRYLRILCLHRTYRKLSAVHIRRHRGIFCQITCSSRDSNCHEQHPCDPSCFHPIVSGFCCYWEYMLHFSLLFPSASVVFSSFFIDL